MNWLRLHVDVYTLVVVSIGGLTLTIALSVLHAIHQVGCRP